MRKIFFLTLFAIALMATALAQDSKPQQDQKPAPEAKPPEIHAQAGEAVAPKQQPEAKPSDVDTIEHIMAATYDVISGPQGDRDWDRFRSLFYKDARLIPSGRRPDGTIGARSVSVEDYIERSRPIFLKEGFFERAVSNKVEEFDHMAEVWSVYESRHSNTDKEPFQRGINSFQLINDGKRWWVLTIYWQGEDKGHPIPSKYLGTAAADAGAAAKKK
ncbi:MAG: hypothetical protein ACJ71N_14195 [Terriglobales bacterium]